MVRERSQRELYELIFNGSPVPAVMHDGDFRISLVNDAMVKLTGRSRDELVGGDAREVVFEPGTSDPRALDAIEASWRGDRPPYGFEGTLAVWTADGQRIPVRVSVQILSTDGEDRVGVILQVVDISRERKVQSALDRAREDAALFAARIGHDLLNPLTAAHGLAVMSTNPDLDEQHRQLARDRVVASLEGAMETVHVLSAHARRTSDETWEQVDLRELVDGIRALADSPLAAIGGTLECTVADDDIVLPRTTVRTVLANLIDNAIKYRDEQRPLRITVRRERSVPYLHLVVADNGRGVAEDSLEEIFQEGTRLETEGLGGGHGLAACRRMIEQADGSIQAEPAPDGGLEVHVRLPRRAPTASRVSEHRPSGAAGRTG